MDLRYRKVRRRAPVQCSIDALKDRTLKYRRIPKSLAAMKACLAQGLPFVFGISVYESFESNAAAQTGMIPMPSPTEQYLGGHALMACGYDDASQRFLFRNSWGPWGKQGYGTIPYAFLTSAMASDFWEIQVVGSVVAQMLGEFERLLGMPGD